MIDDINGNGIIQLCDVDNYPFGWADGTAAKGPEDVKRNGTGTTFSQGDALQVANTDSWDDNQPSGCIQTPAGDSRHHCAGLRRRLRHLEPGASRRVRRRLRLRLRRRRRSG